MSKIGSGVVHASNSSSSTDNKKISVLFVCLGNICSVSMSSTSPVSRPVEQRLRCSTLIRFSTKAYTFSSHSGRSPMAHAVFLSHIDSLPPDLRAKFGTIDSAGTGAYHTGDLPDDRTLDVLETHEISNFEHGARKVHQNDFERFDYILGMDGMNLGDLRRLERKHSSKRAVGDEPAVDSTIPVQVSLFGKYGGKQRKGKTRSNRAVVERDVSDGEEVIDPYYGGEDGFEVVYEQVDRFSKAFLGELLGNEYAEHVSKKA